MRLSAPTGDTPWRAPSSYWPALTSAIAGRPLPCATLDATAVEHNASDLVHRAAGLPIRVATKSVRSRPVLQAVLQLPGFAGVLAYTLAEAVWASTWCADVVLGYPTADRAALSDLLADERACRHVTLMIDSIDHLDLIDSVAAPGVRPEVRVAIELDLAYDPPRAGRITGRIGVYRSPISTVTAARALARAVVGRAGFALVGAMGYEAQLAGIGDALLTAESWPGRLANTATSARTLILRRLQSDSWFDVLARRAAMVAAISDITGGLEFVNGGGTGSIHLTRQDPSVTEVAAGSGLFGPTLFDGYRAFTPAPAAAFALPVVRRPSAEIATVLGGGWIASGPPGPSRVPRPVWPQQMRMIANEGAGEVQTPLRGPGASDLRVGDLTWWRHAKAGELCEHIDELVVVRTTGRAGAQAGPGDVTAEVVDTIPTYRGEGKAFL
ncbi:MAG: amino acid deaminase/aldolase [Ornithinimicrobium sp.]|uniref:amino acid deaminase/aldolase n=1 Tax=Ornithinimicrobium sp. TaxID=1977084 RepID=UPI0026DEBF08|nr:amino acid deaminase/aldolase [Ornithinimicrobium sp.]MDO5740422.1 amino acid deaminase/aldolase [Ornithinimicrobium sp.]